MGLCYVDKKLNYYFYLGFILKMPIFGQVSREHLFDDELAWEVPEADHEDHRSAGSSEPMFVQQRKTTEDSPL